MTTPVYNDPDSICADCPNPSECFIPEECKLEKSTQEETPPTDG